MQPLNECLSKALLSVVKG